MLNAPVGMQRAFARFRPTRLARAQGSVRFHRRSIDAARDLKVRAASIAANAHITPVRVAAAAARPVRGRFGPDAVLPVAVALILTLAAVVSWLPGVPARGAVGDVTSAGSAPRLAVGGPVRSYGEPNLTPVYGRAGGVAGSASAVGDVLHGPPLDYARFDPDAAAAAREAAAARADQISGPFLADGTLLKPVAVDATLADGKHLLGRYKVKAGDSLRSIADRFKVSAMSIVWANDLTSKTLKVGKTLVIPPFNGLVVTVKEGDTLDGLAKQYEVDANKIYTRNELEDRVLIAGQTLILPGAKGDPLPSPRATASSGGGGGGGTVRPPATYNGGSFAWPVVGGGNSISRGFTSGHQGLDIQADYGSKVIAAGTGTVTFAGWKSNGGGYQVWVAHGSGLYTTYNHMSAVSVGAGQQVSRGQQVGRVGQSGWATGPHLHFEVWRGKIWNGGYRVNPLGYL